MSLALYGHPFSAYTQKAHIALYENDTPYEFRLLAPESPEHTADWLKRWPIAQFPLLVDDARTVAETSIIIEYLQLRHPGPVRLIPEDPMSALAVRFLDRFFDLHILYWVQYCVGAVISGDAKRGEDAMALAKQKLEVGYAWIETQLGDRTWAAGAEFTLADCAAAPALFYADWTHPIAEKYPLLRAYRARLLARPSFARAVDNAQPYRSLFPLGAPDRD